MNRHDRHFETNFKTHCGSVIMKKLLKLKKHIQTGKSWANHTPDLGRVFHLSL